MKSINFFAIAAAVALMISCTETFNFPISEVTPAADITAEIKKESEPNYLVTLEANNLAAPERLEPPMKIYVIWAVSKAGVVRNVGHFTQDNAVKSTYKASFPYQPVEIFITAENQEGNCLPTGVEISRVKFIKLN
ncbi:hypothetical protein [Paucihalobacter sp.]|uniref:hypothetical protein n=1 Tax=Paucihalobacter sp. TaxID=2850405 RepID=UPI002FE261DA